MSRHDGVSCDVCHRANFTGKRYACLICFDYDLCSSCHEVSGVSGNHKWDHPMQCIPSKRGYELYYGSENTNKPQSFICPLCGEMGFSESDLIEHVDWNHGSENSMVICPLCAGTSRPGPVQPRDDLLHHLSVDHRQIPRDFTSILDDHPNHSNNLRRLLSHSRPLVSTGRGRRTGMYIVSSSTATSNPSERSDPPETVSELLSQLSMAGLGQEAGVLSSRVRVPLTDIARGSRLPPFASQTSGTSTETGGKPTQTVTVGDSLKRAKTYRDPRFLLPRKLDEDEDSASNAQLSVERAEFLKQLMWSSLRSRIEVDTENKAQ